MILATVRDIVECPDHAALEDAPKAFDCLSVDRANNVSVGRMVNGRMRMVKSGIIALAMTGLERTLIVPRKQLDN